MGLALTFLVVGNQLRWNGVTVTLRGVAMGDPLDARGWRPTSDYTTIATTWNANCVRLSVQSLSWRDNQADLITALEQDVAAALAADMWVIITWHTIGWPDGYTDNPVWYDTSYDLAASFWTDMRTRFGDEPRILFELWNEPLSETAYSDPNSAVWPELKAVHESLIALIRAESDNVCLCSGDWNSFDLRGIAGNPITADNVGYVWHCYPIDGEGEAADWTPMLEGLQGLAPVVVTEWGFSPDAPEEHYYGSAASFGDGLVSFLASQGLHWTAWCWHPEWGPPMLTGAGWDGVTTYGAFVQGTLAGLTQDRPSDEPPEEGGEDPPVLTLRRRVLRRVPATLSGGSLVAAGPPQTVRLIRPSS